MLHEENYFGIDVYNGPLERAVPVTEGEIHSMMVHELDAPKAIAELVADRFEESRHHQLMAFLIGSFIVAGILIAVICVEHSQRKKFEELYLKEISNARE